MQVELEGHAPIVGRRDKIIDLIESGDAKAATATPRAHLDSAWTDIMANLAVPATTTR